MQGYELEWPDSYKLVPEYTPLFEFRFAGKK
jgi:hypothetical protein